jgi:hypothetical protein
VTTLIGLALGLWHCELNEPEKPPFHRLGTAIIEGSPFEADTVVDYRVLPLDTLKRFVDSSRIADTQSRPGYDTLVLRYALIRFEAITFTRRRDLVTPRQQCDVDSGVAGNTAPPTLNGCKPIPPIRALLENKLFSDTNWVDTLFDTVQVLPRGGPVFLPTQTEGIWRTTLNFPDSILPVLRIANSAQESLYLATGSWPGPHRFSGLSDSLHLQWPHPRVFPNLTSSATAHWLGQLRGNLAVTGAASQLTATYSYEASRIWLGLIPAQADLDDYWTLPLGKPASLVQGSDFRRFSMETDAPGKDSLIALRSRFSLAGNFKAQIRLTLPPQADSGCMVGWFFAPPDVTPWIEYQKGTRTSAARFNLFTEGVGFYMNTTGRLNPPLTLLRTGEAHQINQLKGNKSFPSDAVIQAVRNGQTITYTVCEVSSGAAGSNCAEMATLTPVQGESSLPNALQMHIVVGGFGKTAFQVTWQDLTISEGVLEP